jgi:hypothetical protein
MKSIVVGFKAPRDVVRAIDAAASNELLSRGAWIRRVIAARLRDDAQKITQLAKVRHDDRPDDPHAGAA